MKDLQDTVAMMASTDYKERFQAEYVQLLIRLKKLNSMLKKYAAGELPFVPSCSYELLYTQKVFMEGYLNVLRQRASIENVPLLDIPSNG